MFEQLKRFDWITPLDEAARALRCGTCGKREAERAAHERRDHKRQRR